MRVLLADRGYVKITHIRLQGIILAVYTKRDHLTRVRDVQVNYTRTGFGGLWGNKGGVSVRMCINGYRLCLVNCHLAAHDHKLDQRIKDYYSIINSQEFGDARARSILAHE